MARASTLLLLLLPVAYSMVVWPVLDRNTTRSTIVRPRNWAEKNLGQWCRNFTVNEHTQCPRGSAFHQFDCCGQHETECCFAIQGWVIVILTIVATCGAIILIFSALLKFNLICPLPYSTKPAPPTYTGIQD